MSPHPTRPTALRAALAAALALACASGGAPSGTPGGASATRGASERNADELVVVDCLLPGTVRQLGRGLTYQAPRRAAKLTAGECAMRGGEYTAYDRASMAASLQVWLPAAQSGDAEAQTYVGEIYEKGIGGQPDYAAAASWYRKAADQGWAPAQINLGQLYELGLGVEKDPAQALNWYRRASGLEEFVTAGEVEGLRRELATSSAEVERLRALLEKQERELRTLRQKLEQKEDRAAAESRALEEARRRLAAASGESERTAGRAEVAAREAELERQRTEIAQLRGEIERLRADAERERARVEESSSGEAIALAGPSIQVVDPKLAIARGSAPAVGLVRPAREREVVGRVEAPAGLLSLRVNDLENPVGADGVFRTTLRIREEGTRVTIVAIDNQGKRASREFVLRPEKTEREGGALAGDSAAGPLLEAPERPDIEFGRYYALVIGNNDYRSLPKLETAMADARAVSQLLEDEYGFEVTSLYDATRYDVMAALNDLRGRLKPRDNLLVYYAGHGELDRVNRRGYWLPVDAEAESPANWISSVQITDMLNAMQARKVLVVADSCYSGALTDSSFAQLDSARSEQEREAWLEKMVAKRSRTALTSGGLAPVLDSADGGGHSVFAKAFIEVLIDNEDVLPGQRLFKEISARTTVAARGRTGEVPQYAPIRFSGHESGDFFFVPGG
jgi:hypothetical protein